MDKGPGAALPQRRTENTDHSPFATPIPLCRKDLKAQGPACSLPSNPPACFHNSLSPLS